MKYVKLTNNTVTEILPCNPNGLYHPDFVKDCKEANDDVQVGWIYVNGIYMKPDRRKEYYELKMNEINSKRIVKTDSGVTYNNNIFDSDARARENIQGAVLALSQGWIPPPNFVWMTKDNIQVLFTRTDIKMLSLAVTDLVSTTYSKSFEFKNNLNALYNQGATEDEILSFLVQY